jgi:hypothetical protein
MSYQEILARYREDPTFTLQTAYKEMKKLEATEALLRIGLTPDEEAALRQAIDEVIPAYSNKYRLEWESSEFGSGKFADRVIQQMAGYGKSHIIYGIVSCLRFRQDWAGQEIQSPAIQEIRNKIVNRFFSTKRTVKK